MDSLGAKERVRYLQSVCSQVESAAENLLSTMYGQRLTCGCASSSGYDVSGNSLRQTCCGNICGAVHWTGRFDSSGTPNWEKTCIAYSKGRPELNGKTVCHKSQYSGTKIKSCDSNVDGTSCNGCEVCGNLPYPYNNIQYGVPDCTNIQGFEFMNFDCEDLDTMKELEDISLK